MTDSEPLRSNRGIFTGITVDGSATIAENVYYSGSINIEPGSGITFDGKTIAATGSSGSIAGVAAINGQAGTVQILAGSGIDVTTHNGTIGITNNGTIAAGAGISIQSGTLFNTGTLVPGQGIVINGGTVSSTISGASTLRAGDNIVITGSTIGVVENPSFDSATIWGNLIAGSVTGGTLSNSTLQVNGNLYQYIPYFNLEDRYNLVSFIFDPPLTILPVDVYEQETGFGGGPLGTIMGDLTVAKYWTNHDATIHLYSYHKDGTDFVAPLSAAAFSTLPLGSGLDIASGSLYATGGGGGSTGTQVQSLQGSSATQIQTFSITGGVYNAALYAVIPSTSFSNSTITFASIALINTSTENTPSPFQQFIDVPSITMANANATLTNVQFSDPSGATIIPSWRESGTVNNENAHYWLLMEQGVPASSTIYAIVQYFKNGSNILNAGTTGLAPTLPEFYDQSYGTNDTGTIVFPELYDNYAGSLLNTIWTSQGTGNVTVNNVLNVGGGNNTYTFVASTLAFTYPIVAENFVNTNTTGGDPRFYYVGLATSTVLNTTGLANNSDVDYINSYAMFNTQIMGYGISGGLPQIVSTISNVTGTLQQIGIAWDSSSPLQTMYVDDVATVVANSSSVTIGNYNMFVGQANGGVGSGTITVQYSRVRAYPPSGTAMPTNSLSQSVTSTVTMGVNYNDPTIGYTSIYPISTITLTSAEKTSYTVPISTGSGSITISYIGNGAYFSYRVG